MPANKKRRVFVLMPFAASFDPVYKCAIKPACKDMDVSRVDEQIFAENILSQIYKSIRTADLIVADVSDRNPNVFYEVGYAHAMGKTTILLTQNAADIPFDLKQMPHLVYSLPKTGATRKKSATAIAMETQDPLDTLRIALAKKIQWHFDNPDEPSLIPEGVRRAITGVWKAHVEREVGPFGESPFVLDFDLHLRIRNDAILGEYTVSYSDGMSLAYKVTGEYLHARFLVLNCRPLDQAPVQFAVMILERTDDFKSATGRLLGYGMHGKHLIEAVTITKGS